MARKKVERTELAKPGSVLYYGFAAEQGYEQLSVVLYEELRWMKK